MVAEERVEHLSDAEASTAGQPLSTTYHVPLRLSKHGLRNECPLNRRLRLADFVMSAGGTAQRDKTCTDSVMEQINKWIKK